MCPADASHGIKYPPVNIRSVPGSAKSISTSIIQSAIHYLFMTPDQQRQVAYSNHIELP